jgi:hypothetical protein
MATNKILKALLITFIIATLVLATVVTIIVATDGIVTSNGVVTTKGALRIQTDPDNIKYSIYVNEQKVEVVDKKVEHLDEGEYTIKIQADKYSDWEKKVVIRKNIVSDIFVKLYPKNLDLTQITKSNIDRYFFSSDSNYIYYVISNADFGSDKGIWRIPTQTSSGFFNLSNPNPIKLLNLENELSDIVKNANYEIVASNDNAKILLKDNTNNAVYLLSATELNKAPLTRIDKLLGYTPETIQWFNNSSNLLIANSNILYDYNIANNTSTLISYNPTNKIVFTSNNNNIFVYNSTTKLLYTYQNQKLDAVEIRNVALPNDISEIKLAPSNKNNLYFKSTTQGYYYLNLDKLYLKKIFDFAINDSALKAISSDGSAAIFSINKTDTYTFTAIENPALNQIETKLVKLDKYNLVDGYYKFTPQSTHIIFFDTKDSTIKVIERDGSNLNTLFKESGAQPSANFNAQGDFLYIAIKDNDSKTNLYKVQLNDKHQ